MLQQWAGGRNPLIGPRMPNGSTDLRHVSAVACPNDFPQGPTLIIP
jgi:hypothetical protein